MAALTALMELFPGDHIIATGDLTAARRLFDNISGKNGLEFDLKYLGY